MSDGVVLMRVTLSATGGQPHPDGPGGGDPVDRGIETKFQGIDSAFFVELGVSVKPGGGFLFLRSVGQHVPGQLLDGELVVGHVVVKSPDHPVAVGPDVAGTIFLVAIAVGVACEVEPLASPFLPIMRGGKQLVDQALVGIRSFVADESVGLFGGGGQTDQVEIKSSDQRIPVGFFRWIQVVLGKIVRDEGIDRITDPSLFSLRYLGRGRRREGPVLVVLRAFFDPLIEQVLFLGREGGMRLGRGHDLFRVVRADAVMKFALLDLAGNDDLVLQGILPDVETEFCLSSFLVGPVASIALACQQRSDFTVEINRLRMNR